MIDRKALVSRHNPILTAPAYDSPLTVGNGEFAFTADPTGMQTLYAEYQDVLPLCTMSHWGWHCTPVSDTRAAWGHSDVELTEYDYRGRTVRYAVEKKSGNEAVYDWVRQNPHRMNLGRIGLCKNREEIPAASLSDIRQELRLYEGLLDSAFSLDGAACRVTTACAPGENSLSFRIESPALGRGLGVKLSFAYPTPGISASDWESESRHATSLTREKGLICISRKVDGTNYFAVILADDAVKAEQIGSHNLYLKTDAETLSFSIRFSEAGEAPASPEEIAAQSRAWWRDFWEKGGAIDFSACRDERAFELERRTVLSQYLLAIQSSGAMPPAETGLTCNSWYGKFHLEMHPWHAAWLPLWGHAGLLERSIGWYHDILPKARENAAKNGYKGARWPKMVGPEGVDVPSPIATLLIWQQPHIVMLLEFMYQREQDAAFLQKHWPLVEETAAFMADYAVWNPERGRFELLPPLIPVQEVHKPHESLNPAFELEQWRMGLRIALLWAKRLGLNPAGDWLHVADNMAPLPEKDGLYLAHDNCPDTFERCNRDHPSMLGALGVLPGESVDHGLMRATLLKVLDCWQYKQLWGWDFAMMAMTAARLGESGLAVDILLADSPKNTYVKSGNNFQQSRPDLPLYLPGNGGLLWALAVVCQNDAFPKDGNWDVRWEGLSDTGFQALLASAQ